MNIPNISYFNKIRQFDEITRFRLLNAFIFSIGLNLFAPILMDLKGEYLAAWVISVFMIGEQISVKTNRFMTENFTLSDLYRIGTVSHVVFIFTAFLYFINPLYMVILEGILSIVVITVFGSYSIKLNNYIAENYPENMNEFQIVKNSTWADGLLIGLGFTTFLTYFFPISIGLICFIIYNSLFTAWLIYNWSFYYKKNL